MSQAPADPRSRSPSDRRRWRPSPLRRRQNRKRRRNEFPLNRGTRPVPHRFPWFARRFHGGPDRADASRRPSNRAGSRRAPSGRVPGLPDSASPVGRLRVSTPTLAPRRAHAGVAASRRTDRSGFSPSSANRRVFQERPCVLLYHTIVLPDNTYCRPHDFIVQGGITAAASYPAAANF